MPVRILRSLRSDRSLCFTASFVSDYDLHDLQDIQSRSLFYLHSLVEALRTAGVRTVIS